MKLEKFNDDYGKIISCMILLFSIIFIGYSTQDMSCQGSGCYVSGSIGGTEIELREHFNVYEWIIFILSGMAIVDLLYLWKKKEKEDGMDN